MNIYDIAGNVWEWTLEYTSLSYSPCAGRGGNYGDTGSSHPASNRNGDNTTNSYCSLGFRLSLYQENLNDEGDRPESEGKYQNINEQKCYAKISIVNGIHYEKKIKT